MQTGDRGLASIVAKMSLLAAGIVLAAVLAACSTGETGGGLGLTTLLAAVMAAGVAGWAMHASLHNHVVRPLRRLATEANVDGEGEIEALEAALDAARRRSQRLTELEAQTASLRHDLRGILSPALMTGDRLAEHDDPKIRKAGDVIVRTVNRATDRLSATREGPTAPTAQIGTVPLSEQP